MTKKNIMGFCLIFTILCGIGKYLCTPTAYKAEVLLSYRSSNIDPSKMSPDVKVQTAKILATFTEELTRKVTRSVELERLIKKYNLYQEMRKRQPMQDIVAAIRGEDAIKIFPDERGGWFLFTVEFQSTDAETAAAVVNALATEMIKSTIGRNNRQDIVIKMMDAVRKPEKPFKPDLEKIMAIAIVLGLASGGILAFGIELIIGAQRGKVRFWGTKP